MSLNKYIDTRIPVIPKMMAQIKLKDSLLSLSKSTLSVSVFDKRWYLRKAIIIQDTAFINTVVVVIKTTKVNVKWQETALLCIKQIVTNDANDKNVEVMTLLNNVAKMG